MRRTLSVLFATVGGLVLLANFHTTPALTSPAAASGTAPSTTITQPAAGGPPFGRGGRGDDDGPFTVPSTNPPPTTAPPTTTPAAGGANRVIDGPVEENRYGPVQVRVTMSGDRIVDVQALQLPSDRSRSYQISQVSGPILRQEALAAQSAQIHTVSGATYTSIGYRQSLQAALDQAAHS